MPPGFRQSSLSSEPYRPPKTKRAPVPVASGERSAEEAVPKYIPPCRRAPVFVANERFTEEMFDLPANKDPCSFHVNENCVHEAIGELTAAQRAGGVNTRGYPTLPAGSALSVHPPRRNGPPRKIPTESILVTIGAEGILKRRMENDRQIDPATHCRYFAEKGTCKDGQSCHYIHSLTPSVPLENGVTLTAEELDQFIASEGFGELRSIQDCCRVVVAEAVNHAYGELTLDAVIKEARCGEEDELQAQLQNKVDDGLRAVFAIDREDTKCRDDGMQCYWVGGGTRRLCVAVSVVDMGRKFPAGDPLDLAFRDAGTIPKYLAGRTSTAVPLINTLAGQQDEQSKASAEYMRDVWFTEGATVPATTCELYYDVVPTNKAGANVLVLDQAATTLTRSRVRLAQGFSFARDPTKPSEFEEHINALCDELTDVTQCTEANVRSIVGDEHYTRALFAAFLATVAAQSISTWEAVAEGHAALPLANESTARGEIVCSQFGQSWYSRGTLHVYESVVGTTPDLATPTTARSPTLIPDARASHAFLGEYNWQARVMLKNNHRYSTALGALEVLLGRATFTHPGRDYKELIYHRLLLASLDDAAGSPPTSNVSAGPHPVPAVDPSSLFVMMAKVKHVFGIMARLIVGTGADELVGTDDGRDGLLDQFRAINHTLQRSKSIPRMTNCLLANIYASSGKGITTIAVVVTCMRGGPRMVAVDIPCFYHAPDKKLFDGKLTFGQKVVVNVEWPEEHELPADGDRFYARVHRRRDGSHTAEILSFSVV